MEHEQLWKSLEKQVYCWWPEYSNFSLPCPAKCFLTTDPSPARIRDNDPSTVDQVIKKRLVVGGTVSLRRITNQYTFKVLSKIREIS